MDTVICLVLNQGAECERLILRPLKETDVEDMFEYSSCEETCRFLKWGPHKKVDETLAFIVSALENYKNPKDILWGIEERESGRLIGVIRIYDFIDNTASISYILNIKYTGRGYMTEAVNAAINTCLNILNIETVIAFFAEENAASEQVMKRCGMTKSKMSPETIIIKGKKTLLYKYSISRSKQP